MLQQNFNDMFYFIGSPSPLFVLFMCVALPWLAFPFLIYFILFDSIGLCWLWFFRWPPSPYLLLFFTSMAIDCSLRAFTLSLFVSLYFSLSLSFSLCVLLIHQLWWYCGNIEMSVFISILLLFLFSLATHTLARLMLLVAMLLNAFFYTWWSVRKVLIIRILWVRPSSPLKQKLYARTKWNFMWTCLYRKLLFQPFFSGCHLSFTNPKATSSAHLNVNAKCSFRKV